MSLISVDRSKYHKTKTGLHCGDVVATALLGLTLEQVYATGAAFLPEENEASLREQYGKLNPGQQRMAIGNRLRKVARVEGFNASALSDLTGEYRAINEAAAAAAKAAKDAEKAQKAQAKADAKAAKDAAKAEAKAAKPAKAEPTPAPAPKAEKPAKAAKANGKK